MTGASTWHEVDVIAYHVLAREHGVPEGWSHWKGGGWGRQVLAAWHSSYSTPYQKQHKNLSVFRKHTCGT